MAGFLKKLFGGTRNSQRQSSSETKRHDDEVAVVLGQNDRPRRLPEIVDHLGPAAAAKEAAKQAVRERRLDDAWRLIHEQQQHYLSHANRQGFTAEDTLRLISEVHIDLANILRLEGKHDQALSHVLYYSVASGKGAPSKLGVYFRRCKFKGCDESSLAPALERLKEDLELRTAQLIVSEWRGQM